MGISVERPATGESECLIGHHNSDDSISFLVPLFLHHVSSYLTSRFQRLHLLNSCLALPSRLSSSCSLSRYNPAAGDAMQVDKLIIEPNRYHVFGEGQGTLRFGKCKYLVFLAFGV
jgi:hypothetical protein